MKSCSELYEAHACNPSTWEQRQEDREFEGSLGYTAGLSLKKKKKKREKGNGGEKPII
jgi:hypothetical protein